jgi:hypothetical protein
MATTFISTHQGQVKEDADEVKAAWGFFEGLSLP